MNQQIKLPSVKLRLQGQKLKARLLHDLDCGSAEHALHVCGLQTPGLHCALPTSIVLASLRRQESSMNQKQFALVHNMCY